jgi:D-alanyl-D-alanine carboxypeptidase (penicillin-binding protein 5/6)
VRLTLATRALAVAALACALQGPLVAAPAGAAERPPGTRAAAAILVDAATGEVLHERRADEPRSIASATKLMTALLALERAEPTDVFTAPAYDASPVESRINLREGEQMTV